MFPNQRPADMSSIVNAREPEEPRVPRSFAAAHPGYGANAITAADEKLAEELAARRGSAAPTTTKTTNVASEHATPLEEIDARLETARKATAAAKAAYEAALAAEEGLEAQREMSVKRGGRMDTLKSLKVEKMKRRERALAEAQKKKKLGGMKPLVGAKPVGVQKKVVERKKSGVKKIAEAVTEKGGLDEGFLEE